MSKKHQDSAADEIRGSAVDEEAGQVKSVGKTQNPAGTEAENPGDSDMELGVVIENELNEAETEERGDFVELPEPEQDFEELDLESLLPMLEALLFAAEDPVNAKEVHDSIPALVSKNVPLLIQALDDWYGEHGRGLTVQRVAGGWRLATRPEFADVIRRHLRGKMKGRLSRASLETISIIAYRQPVSRPEVDQMRGVDSSPVIRNLLERELVRVVGRAEAPGRPILYATTEKFLEYFGLEDLASLPRPEEILGELEQAEAGTTNNLRSGPFEGAGAGVEEETYRTDPRVHGETAAQEEPEEEEAPMRFAEPEPDENGEPQPEKKPPKNREKDDQD